MKEFDTPIKSSMVTEVEAQNKIEHVTIYFLTRDEATQRGFGQLFDHNDPDTEYALALASDADWTIVKGALVDIDHRRFAINREYLTNCRNKARKVFGLPASN